MLLHSYRIQVIPSILTLDSIKEDRVVNTLIKEGIIVILEGTKTINKIIIRIIRDIIIDINIITSIIHIQITINKIISNQINFKELTKAIKLYNKINKQCLKIQLVNNSSSPSHPPLPPLAHHSLPRPSQPLRNHSYSSQLPNLQTTQENLCHRINRRSNRTLIHKLKINQLNSNKHHFKIQRMIQI